MKEGIDKLPVEIPFRAKNLNRYPELPDDKPKSDEDIWLDQSNFGAEEFKVPEEAPVGMTKADSGVQP